GGGSNPPPPPPPPPPGSGLDARPNNTTCLAPDRTTGTLTFATPRFTTLTFSQPVAMLQAPGDDTRWFVVEQGGFVRTFQNDQAASSSTVFVNATGVVNSNGSEMGLLGMAFHPDWPTDARVFLAYTAGGSPLVLRIAEWESTDNGLTLPNTPSRTILTINKSNNETNHNGGGIAFSPVDGYLYLGMGDGGGANDNHGQIGNAQLLTTLQGKMVRIDVDGSTSGAPYAIPPDNPFASSTALCGDDGSSGQNCPEIYAYGLRNPWRWSFDRQTGQLWLGDVGQGAREEHNRIVLGGNYGWRCFEGTRDTNFACGNNPNPLPPVAEYARTEGFSTTGGYVYRGTAIPALVGRYVFADFGSGRIWHVANDTAPTVTVTSAQAFDTSFSISSFGEGHDGELYLLNYASGQIHRLTASTSGGGGGVATQLSDTGCVNASNPSQPASGLIPYAPNAPFWSDGATKERWIGLPNGQNIAVGGNGDWSFPNGAVLVKNFRLGQQLVETRLFMRHPDGVWAGYSYEWNSQQTDATLVVGGKQATVGGQTWVFPSSAQCLQCHTEVAGRTLGLETRQLAFSIAYPQTGRTANQLVTLNAINTLSPPIANPASETPYPDPAGTAGTVQDRARSYLHTNCAQCHQPGGPAPGNLDLRYSATLQNTNACNVAPTAGDLGIANALIIAAGDANRSVLLARMNRRDANQMPPLASTLVDTGGVTLVRDWINSLTTCN
ncbi:MAG TPA: PQQ-dependent sugar dehydrogenase, partial [Steroidobacteraceae bacterium]|nr:PQQ-dependent sugar dehydrogenase [Steroidobacteraceae bacterium]